MINLYMLFVGVLAASSEVATSSHNLRLNIGYTLD